MCNKKTKSILALVVSVVMAFSLIIGLTANKTAYAQENTAGYHG